LIPDGAGNFYGTGTAYGPAGGSRIFELVKGSGTLTTLASFSDSNQGAPTGSLVLDNQGNLYGTALGSARVRASIFELANGSRTITTLASLGGSNGDKPDGVILDSRGNLYGVTQRGGASGDGTLFELANLSPDLPVVAGSGAKLTDSATLSGGFNPTGTITFTLYGPSNAVVDTETVTVIGNGTYSTPAGYAPTAAGTYQWVASYSGDVNNTSISSTLGSQPQPVNPAAASQLVLSDYLSSTTAGNPVVFIVTALDSFGNLATGYTGTIQLASTDGRAVLPSNYTFVPGDSGVHVFTSGLMLITAGSQTITARDTVNTSLTATATVAVNAAAAMSFGVSGPPSVSSGSPFDVTLAALDPFGNIDVNYLGTVTFTTSDADSSVVLPLDYSFTAADAGVHTFAGEVTLITNGDQTVTVTDTVSGITSGATVTVVPPGGGAALLSPRSGNNRFVPGPTALRAPKEMMAFQLADPQLPTAEKVRPSPRRQHVDRLFALAVAEASGWWEANCADWASAER
jgi:uncharacterized repeat protein (TIGR03803 family)